jgi:hypothetical protein
LKKAQLLYHRCSRLNVMSVHFVRRITISQCQEPVGEGNGTGWWRVPASVVWAALIFNGMICILGGRLRKADSSPALRDRDDNVCSWPG